MQYIIVLCGSYDMCEFDGNSLFFSPLSCCIQRNREDGIGIRLFSCNFHVIPKQLTPFSHKYLHPVNSLGFISPSTPPSMCPGYVKRVFCILTLLPEEDVSHTLVWKKERVSLEQHLEEKKSDERIVSNFSPKQHREWLKFWREKKRCFWRKFDKENKWTISPTVTSLESLTCH